MTEHARSQRFGWTALAAWATTGLVLEGAHGLKLAAVLDDRVVRMLLLLAHAHGVGTALVVLAWSGASRAHEQAGAATTGSLLRAGAALLPLGFLLGVVGHAESDPGPGVLLAPLGGLLLVAGLVRAAAASWRATK